MAPSTTTTPDVPRTEQDEILRNYLIEEFVEDFKEGRAARNRVRQDLMDPSKALIFNQELAKRIGKKQGDITAEDQESEIRRRYPISIENPRLAPGQPGETPGGVAKAAKRPDPAGIRD